MTSQQQQQQQQQQQHGKIYCLIVMILVLVFLGLTMDFQSITKLDISRDKPQQEQIKLMGYHPKPNRTTTQSDNQLQQNRSYCWLGDTGNTSRIDKFLPSLTFSFSAETDQFRMPFRLTCPSSYPREVTDTEAGSFLIDDQVTISLSYYGHPGLLLKQLHVFSQYPKHIRDRIKVLIIDDGSPTGLHAEDYVLPAGNRYLLDIRLIRIDTDIVYNMAGAKNLAVYLCETTRILLLDIDLIISHPSMEQILKLKMRQQRQRQSLISSWALPGRSSIRSRRRRERKQNMIVWLKHKFNRRNLNKIHPGVTLVHVHDYFAVGGCDEDFSGSYGHEDTDFEYRWSLNQKQRKNINQFNIYLDQMYTNDVRRCDTTLIQSKLLQEQCTNASKSLPTPTKNPMPNERLRRYKRESGTWSNRYLRFPWHVVF